MGEVERLTHFFMDNQHINKEENYKHRNLGLHVLSQALDDICPKFDGEPENVRQDLIRERNLFYTEQEHLLDKEWIALEKEAQFAIKELSKEREQAIKRINKSKNTSRIKQKIKNLKRNRDNKIKHVKTRLANTLTELKTQLKLLKPADKKFAQINTKINKLKVAALNNIETLSARYQKIINKVIESDNTVAIEKRIEQLVENWAKKFTKLREQFEEKERAFNNKQYDLDQVRRAVEGFVEEYESIEKWCTQVGIQPKTCYKEVKDRLELLGRNSKEIDDIIDSL